ncbi:hypothetical protein AB2L27_13565 [Kineococcus sp. LSe6-4]|uniref:MFS transporter n=1 Tax=Kineococcus halophytocola TaxID=3234027 RepID=A0ABV4H503_9ACTN
MPTPLPTTGPAGPVRGTWRRVRAGAVAATVLGLAAGAHLSAGGHLPGPFLLLAVGLVLVAVCLLLAGRRFSWPVLAALLGGGQVALHTVFAACSGPAATVVGTGHHQSLAFTGATAASADPGAAMTCAHVAATALALGALLHGESLLWSVWAWLRPVVRLLVRLVRTVAPRPVVPAPEPARPRSVVARRVRRRGPPGVPALATTS